MKPEYPLGKVTAFDATHPVSHTTMVVGEFNTLGIAASAQIAHGIRVTVISVGVICNSKRICGVLTGSSVHNRDIPGWACIYPSFTSGKVTSKNHITVRFKNCLQKMDIFDLWTCSFIKLSW